MNLTRLKNCKEIFWQLRTPYWNQCNPMIPFGFCRQDLKMAARQHFRKEIVLRTLELQAFSSWFKANSFEVVCCLNSEQIFRRLWQFSPALITFHFVRKWSKVFILKEDSKARTAALNDAATACLERCREKWRCKGTLQDHVQGTKF